MCVQAHGRPLFARSLPPRTVPHVHGAPLEEATRLWTPSPPLPMPPPPSRTPVQTQRVSGTPPYLVACRRGQCSPGCAARGRLYPRCCQARHWRRRHQQSAPPRPRARSSSSHHYWRRGHSEAAPDGALHAGASPVLLAVDLCDAAVRGAGNPTETSSAPHVHQERRRDACIAMSRVLCAAVLVHACSALQHGGVLLQVGEREQLRSTSSLAATPPCIFMCMCRHRHALALSANCRLSHEWLAASATAAANVLLCQALCAGPAEGASCITCSTGGFLLCNP